MTKLFQPGIYLQLYRGGMSPIDKKNLPYKLDEYKALGIVGIAHHGFVGDLTVDKFDELSKHCKSRGMLSLAAYGLNDKDPVNKGHEIAKVSNHPDCYATIFDAEGAYEDEVSDKQKAKDMGAEYRSHAPNALVLDQPWPIPNVHMNFPWVEFSTWIDYHADQRYCNNFRKQWGKDAYDKFEVWHKNSWTILENQILKPNNVMRPCFPTFQGYYWYFSSCVKALMAYPTCLVWCEPYAEKEFIFAVKTKNTIQALGFNSVEAYQAQNGLKVDGDCGPLTVGKLGLTPPEGLVW